MMLITINSRQEAAGAAAPAVHSPTLPGSVQIWFGASHAVEQHTPFTQKVDWHWVPVTHDSPRPSGVFVGVTDGVAVRVWVGVLVGVIAGSSQPCWALQLPPA